jgi:hypothetical protein
MSAMPTIGNHKISDSNGTFSTASDLLCWVVSLFSDRDFYLNCFQITPTEMLSEVQNFQAYKMPIIVKIQNDAFFHFLAFGYWAFAETDV